MSHELKEGVQLKEIKHDMQIVEIVGVGGVSEIVIAEQCGEMSMVPWVKVTRNGQEALYNAKMLYGVTLAVPETGGKDE